MGARVALVFEPRLLSTALGAEMVFAKAPPNQWLCRAEPTEFVFVLARCGWARAAKYARRVLACLGAVASWTGMILAEGASRKWVTEALVSLFR